MGIIGLMIIWGIYMKKIVMAAIAQETLVEYRRQLYDFFGNSIRIEEHILGISVRKIDADVVVVLTPTLVPMVYNSLVNKHASIICLQTSIDYNQIEKINKIEDYANIAVISAYRFYARETAEILNKAAKDTLNISAYYQEIRDRVIEDIDVGVYIGDESIKPSFVKRYINLGWKKIHPHTLDEMIENIYPDDRGLKQRLEAYKKDMISVDFSELLYAKLKNELLIEIREIINCIDEGLVILNEVGDLIVCNDKASRYFDMHGDRYDGLHISKIPILSEIDTNMRGLHNNITIDFYDDKNDKYYKVSKDIIYFQRLEFRRIYRIKDTIGYSSRYNNKPKYSFVDIHYMSNIMQKSVDIAKKISKIDSPVLIEGETGTGKELFAHSIHNFSHRKNKPFLAVNCTAFQDSLLESELFGYEPGAFTGALKSGSKGIFEIADGGTVFLDEIGDAPINIQVKLLRVLQEGEIRRIGGKESIPINVRVISATNKDLKIYVNDGRFRKDLYYRLNTYILHIPALRERKEDIRLLIMYFLNKLGFKHKIIDEDLVKYMMKLPWDGNIRELKNCIDYLGYMSGSRSGINNLPLQYQNYRTSDAIIDSDMRDDLIELKGFTIKEKQLVMFIIKQLSKEKMGRRRLYKNAEHQGLRISEHFIRKITNELKDQGYIQVNSGRSGCALTDMGVKLLESI